jgi:hypothetical protein
VHIAMFIMVISIPLSLFKRSVAMLTTQWWRISILRLSESTIGRVIVVLIRWSMQRHWSGCPCPSSGTWSWRHWVINTLTSAVSLSIVPGYPNWCVQTVNSWSIIPRIWSDSHFSFLISSHSSFHSLRLSQALSGRLMSIN